MLLQFNYDLQGNVNSVSVCPKVKESLVMFFTDGQIILDIWRVVPWDGLRKRERLLENSVMI